MAIQKGWGNPSTGAQYPNAYWRVVAVTFGQALQTAKVRVTGWVDQAAATGGLDPIEQRELTIGIQAFDTVYPGTANVSSIIIRAYAWLKTLPEWSGAIDV